MRKTLFALVTLGAVTVIALLVQAGITDKPKNPTIESLSADEIQRCGLNKLAPHEIDALMNLVMAAPRESYLYESAYNYMSKQGWAPLVVYGARRDPEKPHGMSVYQLAHHAPTTYLLEVNEREALEPGYYLANLKGSLFMDVLMPDGTSRMISVSKTY